MKWSLLGFISGIIGWIVILLSIQQNPWFEFTENAFSDLGGPMASNAWLFNYGLMITGLLIIFYGVYLVHLSLNKLTNVGAAFLMITGIFLSLIGLFPSGTRPHYFVSLGFFTLADLSIIAWGAGFVGGERDRLGKLFIGMGITGPLLAYIVPWPSIAAVEAFGIIIMNIWVILMFREM